MQMKIKEPVLFELRECCQALVDPATPIQIRYIPRATNILADRVATDACL